MSNSGAQLINPFTRSKAALSEGFTIRMIYRVHLGQAVDVGDRKFSPGSHRRIFCPQPPRPIPCFKRFEFVSFGTWIKQNKTWDGAIRESQLLSDDAAESRARERESRFLAASHHVDGLKMFGGLGLHRPNYGELVHDRRALWHQLGNLKPSDIRRYRAKGATGDPFGLRVPGLELRGSTTQPDYDAVLLLFLGFICDGFICEQTFKAKQACCGTRCNTLQE
jgi:hypothetical protein